MFVLFYRKVGTFAVVGDRNAYGVAFFYKDLFKSDKLLYYLFAALRCDADFSFETAPGEAEA